MPRIPELIRYHIINLSEEGMGARRIRTHLIVNRQITLMTSTISKIIHKWKELGAVRDLAGRGRRRIVRTERNVNAVREEMEKDVRDRSPKKTPRKLALKLHISRRSVARIIKEDLRLKPYRKVRVCKLSDNNMARRLVLSNALLRRFTDAMVRRIVFSDETYLKLDGYHNKQNSRIYALNKADIPAHELLIQKPTFPTQLMVFFALSYETKFPPIFVNQGDTVNADYYIQNILTPTFASIEEHFAGRRWVFQQDSAPPHRAIVTQNFVRNNVPDFIATDQWPPNSSDLAVLDYGIFADLKDLIYQHRITNMIDLRRWTLFEWNRYPQYKIINAIDAWKGRLRQVVNNNGAHIRYL